jgi:hypothetical protein
MKNDKLIFLWSELAEVVRTNCSTLNLVCDEPGDLRIETMQGRPFVTVRIQKEHVGLYVLPLYYHPDILPLALLQHKSGKSTLKFNKGQEILEIEIEQLLHRCQALIGAY